MYLSIASLYTHLYPEIIQEISRSNVYEYINLTAFPAEGVQRYYYRANDTGLYYTWDGTNYNVTPFTDIVQLAINTGIGEARGFLTRYDVTKMLSNNDEERTFQDDMLDSKVKDLIQWHIVRLCNVNVNFEIARAAYNDALKFFEKVQKGIIDPAWPLLPENPGDLENNAGLVEWNTMNKRRNNY